jgi:hypothetical protein
MAKNVTSEQLAKIRPTKLVVPQEATTGQASVIPAQSEIKPGQTSQEEAEQKEHKPPKQGTDTAH